MTLLVRGIDTFGTGIDTFGTDIDTLTMASQIIHSKACGIDTTMDGIDTPESSEKIASNHASVHTQNKPWVSIPSLEVSIPPVQLTKAEHFKRVPST